MADNGKGTIMSRPSCEWVHQRLPLLVGDGDGLTGEGSDLDAADRDRIERHLVDCAPCRERRAELEQTIAILGLAAEQPAPEPDTLSVWPMLEQRIRQHHAEQSRSRWRRIVRAICPQVIRNAVDRLDRSWGHLPGELPLRLAWAGDSFYDWMSGCSPLARSGEALDLGLSWTATPRLGLGLGVAMAVAVVLLVVAMADRQRFHAEIQIAANTAPIPMLETHRGKSREEAGHVVTATVPSTDTRVSNSLAQADSIPAPEAPAPGRALRRKPSARRQRRRLWHQPRRLAMI